jgi:hypothetical protein
MHRLAASDAGADGPLTIVLGAAVLLLFAGILVRAVVLRRPGQARSAPLLVLVRALRSRLAPRVVGPAAGGNTDPARGEPTPSEDGQTQASPFAETPAGPDRPRPAAAVAEQARRTHGGPASPPPERIAAVSEPEVARLTSETLAPLGRTLDRARRLGTAEDRVAAELATLPGGFWLVERYVLVGTRRIPFLVAGTTGVFVICATDGAWTLHDLHALSDLADDVQRQLPDYDGPVHAAVCLAFDEMKPRSWFGGQQQHGRGGSVVGLDWLKMWMFSFGPEHGLRNGDVRRLHEAAGPFWDRRSTARLPATRNLG